MPPARSSYGSTTKVSATQAHEAFKHWDLGDIIAAEGVLFRTMKGELSVRCSSVRLLSKSLRPLPDKFHGLSDLEMRYRQRYVDLMTNEDSRAVFVTRSKAIGAIRTFMTSHGFLEVETPMLQPIPGGAAARPFVTHHNALDQEMFLRIAPELYLKRLLVGGFERVFEINRSFRNEGLSPRHNPEFTMMEFYAAYTDYRWLMDFTEAVIRDAAQAALGSLQLTYQGREIDLSKPVRAAHHRAGHPAPGTGLRRRCAAGRRLHPWRTAAPGGGRPQAERRPRQPATRACSRKSLKRNCGSPPSSSITRSRCRPWRAPRMPMAT